VGWEGRTVLKLSKPHQELLFEARPDTFSPFRFGPSVWAYVEVGQLDAQELEALIREAWSQVVPKKVSRALTGG
jgi:hypothetical protein